MGFVRFVIGAVDADSARATGLFQAAYDLVDDVDTDPGVRAAIDAHLAWFEAHLDEPDRFGHTTSKGWYRRATRGISWFREEAIEHVARADELAWVLRANGVAVDRVRQDRVGAVFYADAVQVVAEPFRDTETG